MTRVTCSCLWTNRLWGESVRLASNRTPNDNLRRCDYNAVIGLWWVSVTNVPYSYLPILFTIVVERSNRPASRHLDYCKWCDDLCRTWAYSREQICWHIKYRRQHKIDRHNFENDCNQASNKPGKDYFQAYYLAKKRLKDSRHREIPHSLME